MKIIRFYRKWFLFIAKKYNNIIYRETGSTLYFCINDENCSNFKYLGGVSD